MVVSVGCMWGGGWGWGRYVGQAQKAQGVAVLSCAPHGCASLGRPTYHARIWAAGLTIAPPPPARPGSAGYPGGAWQVS